MRKSIILFLTFFLCVAAYAQNLTVSGTVTDKDTKEPLIGVNVLLKGTTIGTVTDFDGKYIPWKLMTAKVLCSSPTLV